MKNYKIYILTLILAFLVLAKGNSQNQHESFSLDSSAIEIPALEKEIDISVSGVSLQEFLRAVANSSGANINVDPSIEATVVNNFQAVKVKDILEFVALNYPIKIELIGNIINVSRKIEENKVETDFKGVKYDTLTQRITLDYYETDLTKIAREITQITEYNIILSPQIATRKVSAYVENMPFEGALEQFAFSNDLKVRGTESGYYIIEPKPIEKDPVVERNQVPSSRNRTNQQQEEEYTLEISKKDNGNISISASSAPLLEVIQKVSDQMGITYFIGTKIEGAVSMNSTDLSYVEFLSQVLKGTKYVYNENKGIFIIGDMESSDYKSSRVYQFQNRTVKDIVEILPEDLTSGLLVNEYKELNSILITGEQYRIDRLINLFVEIDKTIPVILIEIIIVDVNKNYTVSTGIDAGIGDQPTATGGKVFPGLDLQLGSDGLNKILQDFDGFGVLNLGNVTENFYLVLKAIEEQGILKVNSTPKLATLNGQEAIMTIGETEYYLEEQSNFIGTQNPSLSTTQTYKPINAELSITITPYVSGDENITLEIEVIQSAFTERISNTAPPGSVNRTFKSIVRIKNQEMIILGGLDEKRIQDSSTGTPFLSRIPVIKWLFSSRTKSNANSQLNIFIKPTIIG